MATATYLIAPEDGWTAVTAANPAFVRITANPERPFYVAIAGSAPAISTDGVRVTGGSKFWVNQPVTGTVYVKVKENAQAGQNVKINIDVESEASTADANGAIVQSGASSTFWSYAAASGGIVSSTADVVLKAASGAGIRNCLKTLTINHDTLSAVTECVVKDGSTVIWRGKLQTAATDVSNGSGTIIFDPPLRSSANAALNFALITSVTGGVFVNAQGFTGS